MRFAVLSNGRHTYARAAVMWRNDDATPGAFIYIFLHIYMVHFYTFHVILCEQTIFTIITDSELLTELEKIKEIFLIPAR